MAGLPAMLAFAEAARRASFAAAARELGLTASAVAKSVARLEQDLGVRLFHRTTRKLALTSDGRALFARCERIVEEMQALRDEAAGTRAEPSGRLRLNVPITLGKRLIVPALAELRRRHPRIQVEVSFTDRYADLVGEGLDAVVRVGALKDSSLVSRRIGEQQLIAVAAPRYLKQRGTPERPADLAAHACMAFRVPSSGRVYPWQLREGRRVLQWSPDGQIVMDDGEAIVAAAVAGLGVAQVPDYMASDALERGQLVEVMPARRPPPIPVSIVYLHSRGMTPRLRALIDVLAKT
ncbi:MAG TPA: LysR family transcriptional regulator [Gammaproteobacteria bacterium]|nr:LysR family transcriptional regulator [Gammaproteobacteria bacterium]